MTTPRMDEEIQVDDVQYALPNVTPTGMRESVWRHDPRALVDGDLTKGPTFVVELFKSPVVSNSVTVRLSFRTPVYVTRLVLHSGTTLAVGSDVHPRFRFCPRRIWLHYDDEGVDEHRFVDHAWRHNSSFTVYVRRVVRSAIYLVLGAGGHRVPANGGFVTLMGVANVNVFALGGLPVTTIRSVTPYRNTNAVALRLDARDRAGSGISRFLVKVVRGSSAPLDHAAVAASPTAVSPVAPAKLDVSDHLVHIPASSFGSVARDYTVHVVADGPDVGPNGMTPAVVSATFRTHQLDLPLLTVVSVIYTGEHRYRIRYAFSRQEGGEVTVARLYFAAREIDLRHQALLDMDPGYNVFALPPGDGQAENVFDLSLVITNRPIFVYGAAGDGNNAFDFLLQPLHVIT